MGQNPHDERCGRPLSFYQAFSNTALCTTPVQTKRVVFQDLHAPAGIIRTGVVHQPEYTPSEGKFEAALRVQRCTANFFRGENMMMDAYISRVCVWSRLTRSRQTNDSRVTPNMIDYRDEVSSEPEERESAASAADSPTPTVRSSRVQKHGTGNTSPDLMPSLLSLGPVLAHAPHPPSSPVSELAPRRPWPSSSLPPPSPRPPTQRLRAKLDRDVGQVPGAATFAWLLFCPEQGHRNCCRPRLCPVLQTPRPRPTEFGACP